MLLKNFIKHKKLNTDNKNVDKMSTFFYYLLLKNKYKLFINDIKPEKNTIIAHWPKCNGTVWNIPCKKGTYIIHKSMQIETNTAPTKYILVDSLISNIE